MRRSLLVPLLLVLAAVGYHVDRALQSSRRLGLVGEDLRYAAVSPDGRFVAGVANRGSNRWTLGVWETASGRPVLEPEPLPHPPGPTNCLAWSADGTTLVAGAAESVLVLEPGTGRRRQLAAEWLVREVGWHRGMVTARTDAAFYLWDTGGRLVWRLAVPHLLHAAYDGHSQTVAVAAFEDGVRLYDLRSRALRRHLEPSWTAAGLEMCADGGLVATAFRFRSDRGSDHGRVYRTRDGVPLGPPLVGPRLYGFRASLDGSRMLLRSEATCRVLRVRDGHVLGEREAPSPAIDALGFDGRIVATVNQADAAVTLWSAEGGRVLERLEHPQQPVRVRFAAPDLLQVTGGPCAVWRVNRL